MSDHIKIKYWWSEDKKWFCILTNDGVSQSTVSLTPEEASLLSMNAVVDEARPTAATGGGVEVDVDDGDAMDDFIRAILADNNPRSDEPYATVAKWIRKLRRPPRAEAPAGVALVVKSDHMSRVLARIVGRVEESGDWRLSEDELFAVNKASQHLQEIYSIASTPSQAVQAEAGRPLATGTREALITAKCTSKDGTVVHASMNEVLAALATVPQVQAEQADSYLVWSNQHRAWWRPNSCGYTKDVRAAGRYSRDDAISISGGARDGWGKPSDIPDELAIPISALPESIRSLASAATRTGE